MARDRLTLAMMIGIPIMQLILFGYAINADPHHLPTALVARDNGSYSRSIVRAIENTGYFRITAQPRSQAEAEAMIARGDVLFVIEIPTDFGRDLVRQRQPAILVEADATDPVATGNALAALAIVNQTALMHDLIGPLAPLQSRNPAFQIQIHRRYNPEGATELNIVPGLLGTILTMTLALITAVAVTREYERGTMENLLATPARPVEVMIGKIIPYILVGFTQVCVILLAGVLLFHIPILGSLSLLAACVMLFIIANLSVGFTFSTMARNQMQAIQMSVFFFLPSMLLSGFLFPFRGMPAWAQDLGGLLPLTYFLRIVRGILLKGTGLVELWPQIWPIMLFTLIVATIALFRYRQTLD